MTIVTLSPDDLALARRLIENGGYADLDAVVSAGLRQLSVELAKEKALEREAEARRREADRSAPQDDLGDAPMEIADSPEAMADYLEQFGGGDMEQ